MPPLRQIVTAPPAVPPLYGLLVAVPPTSGIDRPGIQWEPEACSAGEAGPADCDPMDRVAEVNSPGVVVSNPFLVWAFEKCTTRGFSARDWQGRARRGLESTQSHHVAAEFWTGEITKTQQADEDQQSPFLADDATVVLEGGPTAPEVAASRVEATAGRCARGRRLAIHVPTWLLEPIMTNTNYIARDGQVLRTALGNVVIPDTGYPGTGPDSIGDTGNSWIYATPLPQIYLDAIEIYPASLTDARDLAAMVNWSKNDAIVWAQRLAMYQLDPCCRFAAETTVPLLATPSTPS